MTRPPMQSVSFPRAVVKSEEDGSWLAVLALRLLHRGCWWRLLCAWVCVCPPGYVDAGKLGLDTRKEGVCGRARRRSDRATQSDLT